MAETEESCDMTERAAKVKDAFTWGIVSVRPLDSVADAIALMLSHHVSGVPVRSDAGLIVGILTEGDLLRRTELGTERRPSGWRAIFGSPGKAADDYTRAHGRSVEELMTRTVVSVELSLDLADAIVLLEENNIKRLLVTDHGRPVGMLSRADVLRVLARMLKPTVPYEPRSDDDIEADVRKAISHLPFGTEGIESSVSRGVARLSGAVLDERERLAIRVAAENVPGVQAVQEELEWVDPLVVAQAY